MSSPTTQPQIQPGDRLPTVSVKEDNPNETLSIHQLEGKIVIVGIPGAFTPPCSNHIPGYIENYDKFVSKGVSQVFVVAVNDAFVVKAWKEKLAPEGTPVRFLADDKGTFVSALGLAFDATSLLGTHRSKRFVLAVKDGVVQDVAVENEASNITVTDASAVLKRL